MWMTNYIRAVKRGLRDYHGFRQVGGSAADPALEDVPLFGED